MYNVVCWLFIVAGALAATSQAELRLPDNNFVAGWYKSEAVQTFTKNDLYGYIDGGAEIFFEFGFVQLLVQRYQKDEHELGLEIYQMENAEAALGIYLMKKGQETPIAAIPARNSSSRYQFMLLKANYFILVNNFSGNEAILPSMITLSQKVLAAISAGKPVKLLERLPAAGLVQGSELLIRGPYALQPIFTFGEGDVFKLDGKIFGVVGDYVDLSGNAWTRLIIDYPQAEQALTAYTHLLSNLDAYLKIVAQQPAGFTFKDYQQKGGLVTIQGATIDIQLHLTILPTLPKVE